MDERFDWDENNLRHIARHGVTPEEFEQVIANAPLELRVGARQGEPRTMFLGRTDARRALVAIATVRGGRVRAVTAYPTGRKFAHLLKESR